MDGKMMTLTFFELYPMYIKNKVILFPYLLANLFNKDTLVLLVVNI